MKGGREWRSDRGAPLGMLRVCVALLLLAHGVARATLGIVDDFGVFLAGLPLLGPGGGLALAWCITAVEVLGGATLAVGRLVVPLSAWFVLQLFGGIALVHAREGWFVVGAGRNGVEYSVLLIAVLTAVAWDGRATAQGRVAADA